MLKFSAERALSKLAAGVFLVARPILRDPNFEGTVLFLCAHEADGDYGLILNRAGTMPLDEVFAQLPEFLRGPRRISVGGPVEQEKVQILDWSDRPAPEAQQVAPGLAMGGQWDFSDPDDLDYDPDVEPAPDEERGKLFATADPETYRIFIGYSGWGAGQLRNEIELGAWDVFEADVIETLKLVPDRLPGTVEDFSRWVESHPCLHV